MPHATDPLQLPCPFGAASTRCDRRTFPSVLNRPAVSPLLVTHQILLNKTDLASREELEEVRERIQVRMETQCWWW